MKRIRIPAFTEEYAINVYIGTPKELDRASRSYGDCDGFDSSVRGRAWDFLPDKHPLIAVDGSLPFWESASTLAHEAVHAARFIADYVGVKDKNAEFEAHVVSAVMRGVMKLLKKK